MLEKAIETCAELGFETYIDDEGYYGYAEIGSGDEMLGILCHLDVVPAENIEAWTSHPFELDVRDEQLFGRGTEDDKGPTIAALFAVKALIDAGYTFNKRIRFIFGTDEETLWRDMDQYNLKEEAPTLGFAPDADFPLTYAEKGLLQIYLVGPGSKTLALDTGGALNVVPDAGTYEGDKLEDIKASLDELGYGYTVENDTLVVNGKSIHSKDAHKGVNAVTLLVEALGQHFNHKTLDFLNEQVANDAHAQNIFGLLEDEMSGPLTFNVANLKISPEESRIGLDLRIPVTVDKDKLVSNLKEVINKYDLTYEEYDYLGSLYVPLDSELVETLLSVYRDLTGDMTEPKSSGGATFARTIDNCVAFGARVKGVESTAHQVDERMTLSNFYEAMEIYAVAVKELATD